MTNTTSNHEKGSILVYALLVITFLSGLAAYLSAISSPVIFEMTDTQKLLQTDLLNDSARNIYSTIVCQKLYNIKDNLQTSTANDVLSKYNNIKLKKEEEAYEFTLTPGGSSIPDNQQPPEVNSIVTNKVKFSKSPSSNRTIKLHIVLKQCPYIN